MSSAAYDSAKELGLYAYDTDMTGDAYERKAIPTEPQRLKDVPENVRVFAERVAIGD
ncbi:MAG: hypothetical protein AB8H80_21995 [Planctomycetota bacterium]